MGELTATKVKALTEPGRHRDGDNLYLNISKGGTKSWVLRYSLDRRRRDMGLGSVKDRVAG